jgi:hypothetical protein
MFLDRVGLAFPDLFWFPCVTMGQFAVCPWGRNDFPRSAAISRWCEPGVTDDEHGSGGYPDRGGKRTWMRW